MVKTPEGYMDAVTATTRRTRLKVSVSAVDPDISYGAITASAGCSISNVEQIHDGVLESTNVATLETDRWVLDGSIGVYNPDEDSTGYVSAALSDTNGSFQTPQVVTMNISGVEFLKTVTIVFPDGKTNGMPVDISVDVNASGTWIAATRIETNGNLLSAHFPDCYNPSSVRVSVSSWSIPDRRVRIAELIPGAYKEWTDNDIISANFKQRGDPSCLTFPYGTADLKVANPEREFDFGARSEIFDSIVGKQRVNVSIGLLVDGKWVYNKIGSYYQDGSARNIESGGATVAWKLVDIFGLLSGRKFLMTVTELPTTLQGWADLVSIQVGRQFAGKIIAHPEHATRVLSIPEGGEFPNDISCGDLLRYICMSFDLWPRIDASTGYIMLDELWTAGSFVSLDNMHSYPTPKENPDIASVSLDINGEEKVKAVYEGVSGTKSVNVKSPFIGDNTTGANISRRILAFSGGNEINVSSRGNPASEIGDVDTIEVSKGTKISGRLLEQEFSFSKGVLSNCKSVYLAENGAPFIAGSTTYTERGVYVVPDDVTTVSVLLVGGGDSGAKGADGTFYEVGAKGADGKGGKVWSGYVNVIAGQTINITVGAGGVNGGTGGNSTFGSFSSANGERYDPAFIDVISGKVYAMTGMEIPRANMGDGGEGGRGGYKGTNTSGFNINPGKGHAGVNGTAGCVIVYAVEHSGGE